MDTSNKITKTQPGKNKPCTIMSDWTNSNGLVDGSDKTSGTSR